MGFDDAQSRQFANADPRPGRFLITGSVELFRSTISPDSLAGRVETIELLPFTQAEIERRDIPDFFARAIACGIVLHDGERIQRLGDRLFAMPVSRLWA